MPSIPPVPGHKPDVPDSFFDRLLRGFADDDIRNFLTGSENMVPYMYRDTKNKITIGVGHLIENEDRATQLPFEHRVDKDTPGPRANRSEIIQAYRNLPSQKMGVPEGEMYPASRFDPASNPLAPLYVDEKILNTYLDDDIRNHRRELETRIPHFDTFPPSARKALLDMQFNMGYPNFSAQKWPRLFEAIDGQDWTTAAEQSRRKDVDQSRNNLIFDLFRRAVEE